MTTPAYTPTLAICRDDYALAGIAFGFLIDNLLSVALDPKFDEFKVAITTRSAEHENRWVGDFVDRSANKVTLMEEGGNQFTLDDPHIYRIDILEPIDDPETLFTNHIASDVRDMIANRGHVEATVHYLYDGVPSSARGLVAAIQHGRLRLDDELDGFSRTIPLSAVTAIRVH